MKLIKTGISWGVRECKTENLLWREYGYLLELFNMCKIITHTCAKSPIISTVGGLMPLYFGRFGNSSRSPKFTRPGDLRKQKNVQKIELVSLSFTNNILLTD